MKEILLISLFLLSTISTSFSQVSTIGLQPYTHEAEQLLFAVEPTSSASNQNAIPTLSQRRRIVDSTNWLHNSFAIAHIELFKNANPDFNNFIISKSMLNQILTESRFHGFRLFYGWKNNKIQIILVKGYIINNDGYPPQNHKSDFSKAYFWNHSSKKWDLRIDPKTEVLEEKIIMVNNKPKKILEKKEIFSGKLKQEIKQMVDAYEEEFNIDDEPKFIKGFYLGKGILDSLRNKNHDKNIRVYLAHSAYKAKFENQLLGYDYPVTQSTFLMLMNDLNGAELARMKQPRPQAFTLPIRVFSTLEIPHCDGVILNNRCISFAISHSTIKPCPDYCGDL